MATIRQIVQQSTSYPILYISPTAYSKMFSYVQLHSKEIGWMGSVDRVDNMTYVLKDVYLLKQKAHGTTCELDPEAILEICEQRIEKGEYDIFLWGHSHATMGVNPSSQDNKEHSGFMDKNSFFIMLIMNKDSKLFISIGDNEEGVFYDNIEYSIGYPEEVEAVKEEIKTKVSELPAYQSNYWSKGGYRNPNTEYWDDEYYSGWSGYTGQKGKASTPTQTTEDKKKGTDQTLTLIVREGAGEEDYEDVKPNFKSDAVVGFAPIAEGGNDESS